jgi:Luciferase-like monooxygenase
MSLNRAGPSNSPSMWPPQRCGSGRRTPPGLAGRGEPAAAPHAVLAKASASRDVISGGRFELGLGASVFWEAVGAMGGPAHSPGDAVDALGEAIDVIRLMWSDQRSVRSNGTISFLVSGTAPRRG